MQPIGYDARFLRYILLSRDFIDAVDASTFGSKMPRADWDFIGNMAVPIPGRKVQSRIADVLDAETTRLDALITAKERMLRLLDEKRRALITRAVTRGINPDVQMRDSGVSWLGKVPAHWQITRLKFVATVRGGLTLGKDYGQVPTIPLPYLRVANVQDGHIDLENVAVVNVPESEAERYLLAPGDVLMNEGGDADKLGRGTVWNGEISPCLHQNHVFAVRPRAVNSEWLDLWTSSEGAKAYFETRARQSTNLASISSSNIRELPIAVPPEDERMQIVASVRQRSAILDELRASTKQSIDLLKERRNTLIATAVTGQLAIPELTEQSPKEEMACSSTT